MTSIEEISQWEERGLLPRQDLPIQLLRRRSGVYTRNRVVPGWPQLPRPIRDATETGRIDLQEASGVPPDGGAGIPAPSVAGTPAAHRPGPPAPPFPLPPGIPFPPRLRVVTEELRVDVDGRAPTFTVSGVIPSWFLVRPLTWIARVARTPAGTWAGDITYRDGTSSLLPQTHVEVALQPLLPIGALSATVTFSGGGAPTVTQEYRYARSWFREVNLEYDTVSDATAVTEYDTASHPNRPATLPSERLTIASTFGHMGINVARSTGDSVIDVNSFTGPDLRWSDVEMHDAMRVSWSRWADIPQWAMWVLFARLHERGPQLGGIMFDDIGAAQRQGCAIFSDSFISTAPGGDPAPAAWVQRMRFWTAVHEIGHCFNLAHSWDKAEPVSWTPLSDEPEARSYMNYPYRVAAAPGKTAEQTFFSDFGFRFSDPELLFLRHAPERFVEMGAASWFDHHAFEQARAATASPLRLELRLHRTPAFDFLEPVTVELKLTNVSAAPLVLDQNILGGHQLQLFVTRHGGQPHAVRPYARRCLVPQDAVLEPGQSLYGSATVSFDAFGFVVDEPGSYTIHAALELDEVDVLAAPLTLRVLTPASREEERLAGDVLDREVGAVLSVGGTRALSSVNDVLADVADRLPASSIAVHANAALGAVAARPGIVLGDRNQDGVVGAHRRPADVETARRRLDAAYADLDRAADTFGHIGLGQQVTRDVAALRHAGGDDEASRLGHGLLSTFEARGVRQEVIQRYRDELT